MLLVVCCGFKLRGGFGSEMLLTQDLDLFVGGDFALCKGWFVSLSPIHANMTMMTNAC